MERARQQTAEHSILSHVVFICVRVRVRVRVWCFVVIVACASNLTITIQVYFLSRRLATHRRLIVDVSIATD